MRHPALFAVGALICSLVTMISAADPDSKESGKGRPERTLTCNPAYPGGCNVSCVTTAGEPLFVYGQVQRAFITEFAGSHTLLEIQKSGDIISVLVGDVSYCTFEGLRDASLLGA